MDRKFGPDYWISEDGAGSDGPRRWALWLLHIAGANIAAAPIDLEPAGIPTALGWRVYSSGGEATGMSTFHVNARSNCCGKGN